MHKDSFLVFVVAVFILLFPIVAFAQTTTSTVDLQALIKQLQAQVAELQTQIQSLKTELRITRVLTQGATGDDVRQLQEFLKTIPDVYPEGLVTGYLGPLTKAAIQRFQERQGIVSSGSSETTGFGIVGPRTASKINELISTGAGASGVTPPGLAPAGSTLPVTPSITGSTVPQTQPQTSATQAQTTSIAPAQSVITTSVSNTSIPNTTTSNTTTSASTSSTSGTTATSSSTTTSTTATSTTSSSSITSTSELTAPSSFTMTGGIGGVTVRWSATDSSVVNGYRVYLTNVGTGVRSGYSYTLDVISTVLGNLSPGNYSAYIVGTVNNDRESAPSPTVTATVTGRLTAPTNFSVSAFSPIFVGLTWVASQGDVSYYAIERNICSSCGADAAFSVSASATSYNDFSVKSGTAYTYRIKAVGTNFGNQSDFVTTSVTTPAGSGSSDGSSSATTSSSLTISQIANILQSMQKLLDQINSLLSGRL